MQGSVTSGDTRHPVKSAPGSASNNIGCHCILFSCNGLSGLSLL